MEMFSVTETKAKKMCKKFPVEYSTYGSHIWCICMLCAMFSNSILFTCIATC